MAAFKYYDGALLFWAGQTITGNYVRSTSTATKIVYLANEFYDPAYLAKKIVFTVSGRTTVVNDETGSTINTGGTITGVSFFAAGDKPLLKVTGLNASLAIMDNYLARGTFDYDALMWDYVLENIPGGALITGSDNTKEAGLPFADTMNRFDMGDDLVTTRGADRVNAGAGNDYISDYGGTDVYDGGAGNLDLLSYHGWRSHARWFDKGIVADLAAGTVVGPDGKTDTIRNVEALRGTIANDVMRGDGKANWFTGGLGADTIDGRGGMDMIYHESDAWVNGLMGVRVNLAAGTARDGFGTTDRISNIEGAVGTEFGDRFFDNGAANLFEGLAGADQFTLSDGIDRVSGGDGDDRFIFTGTFGRDVIEDFDVTGGDRIDIVAANRFGQLNITQDGNAALVSFGGNSVKLLGVDADDLTASHFLFG